MPTFSNSAQDYIYLTFSTHHYVVTNGVRDVAQRMSTCINPARIHLGMPIISLVYSFITGDAEPTVDIHCVGGRVFKGFSHVVMATQANHASRLLQSYAGTVPQKLELHHDMLANMINCLSAIKYCKSVVVNHTDSTLMPQDERDRRDLNLITFTRRLDAKVEEVEEPEVEHSVCVPLSYTMATHVLPTPASTPKSSSEDTPIRVYQTTNPIVAPREDTILSVARLERAVNTVEGKRAVRSFWRSETDWEEDSDEDSDLDSDEITRQWGIKWGCSATQRGTLGPLQGAGRLTGPLRSRRSLPQLRNARKEPGIWICGSYAHSGIPLLEGCVVSAKNVVEQGIWVAEGVEEEGQKLQTLW